MLEISDGSQTMVLSGNKAKRYLSVKNTTETTHDHHHHHHHQKQQQQQQQQQMINDKGILDNNSYNQVAGRIGFCQEAFH